jgi:1-deoxy-D-xylulose-5-phosphate synthase
MIVKNYGISKKFHTDFEPEELLRDNGMSVQNISDEIKKQINK